MGLEAIAIAGLVVSTAGTLLQQQAQKKANKQRQRQFEQSENLRKQAEEKDKQLADLRTVRAKRQAVREAQVRRAEISSGAVNQGVSGTDSAVRGAQGSIQTQAASNVSFLDTSNQLQTQVASLFGQSQAIARRPITVSGTGDLIAGIGGTIFSGREEIAGFFNS